jgi:hypothetical protein
MVDRWEARRFRKASFQAIFDGSQIFEAGEQGSNFVRGAPYLKLVLIVRPSETDPPRIRTFFQFLGLFAS